MKLVKKFKANTQGRDFVVGDVHGSWFKLKQALNNLCFNPETDRLFSVGDLIDRGTDFDLMDEFLGKPFFHAVMGNHEASLLSWKKMLHWKNKDKYKIPYDYHKWFDRLPDVSKDLIIQSTRNLPLAIEIEQPNGLPVVIAHADLPDDSWADVKARLKEIENKDVDDWKIRDHDYVLALFWSRFSANKAQLYHPSSGIFNELYDGNIIEQAHENFTIPDVSKAYFGHTICEEAMRIGNRHFIDLGAVHFEKEFMVVEI